MKRPTVGLFRSHERVRNPYYSGIFGTVQKKCLSGLIRPILGLNIVDKKRVMGVIIAEFNGEFALSTGAIREMFSEEILYKAELK